MQPPAMQAEQSFEGLQVMLNMMQAKGSSS
jgi:hypothetical protein